MAARSIPRTSTRTSSESSSTASPEPGSGNDSRRQLHRTLTYRSKKNEKRIAKVGLVSNIHFRRSPGKALPEHHQRANATRSKVRAHVEHPFAEQKHRMGLFVRTIGIVRARAKIGMANIAYNMKRLTFWEGRSAAA